ncbi:hypothetical protein COCOBI_05-2550 [Coccomyxa sp. Obi]|nr:hypothetical protein COCOBI_05-2550 [Coccomyxa sp. Obi]
MVCRYYISRFKRLAPSLYSMLAIVYFLVLPAIAADLISADARRAFAEVDPFNPGNCPRLLWASFAFVNNMLPFAGCASHTWSTAVQMQFFLLAPLVLLLLRPALPGLRSRVGWAAACTVVAVLGHRAYVMNRIQLWNMIPVPFYGPFTAETQAKMYYMWSASYLSLASHLGAMSIGVLAYLGLSSPSFVKSLARYPWSFVPDMASLYLFNVFSTNPQNINAFASTGSQTPWHGMG